MEIECKVWSIVEDETTEGRPCFVAYDLNLPGCMAQGETEKEAWHEL